MVHDYQWIFDGIDDIDGVKPEGFLLRKAGHRQQLDAFRLRPINTDYFRDALKTKLGEIQRKVKNKEVKIQNFYREDADEAVISVLDVEKHVWINKTIDEIFQTASSNPIDKLDTMQNVKFAAMLFKAPEDKSIIVIDLVGVYSEAFKQKIGLVATYDEKGLKKLGKNAALVFKFGLPCVYFEKTNKLLVIDRNDTEKIFNMLEYYQKKAIEEFEKLENEEIVKIDHEMLQSELKKISIARKVSNMVVEGAFTTDISIYKKYENFLNQHPEFDDELTKLEIRDNTVIIDNKDKLRSFLHLTGHNLTQSVIDENMLYMAFKKRKIKTRSRDRAG